MPSLSERPPSTPSSGRRIISRITSPFASKSRNIADFSIEPDDPLKQHSPGDVVTGSVRLRVSKPTRVTHIVVCLHGYVQVFKNPGSPGESHRGNGVSPATGRGKKAGEYYGNGFASLFEDEVVLCGDGRLAEGAYQFNFELEFPDRDLPSSIDFERGTITYMITATMTRPNTISPIISCDRKVYLIERLDISPLYPPKARTITLEPISRRTRAKVQARKLVDPSDKKSRKTDSARLSSDLPRQSEASSTPSTQAENDIPVSPAPSEISFDSSHGRASQADSQQRESPSHSESGKVNASRSSLVNKVISVTIESEAGGCLRGDSVPIKINVSHTKHVRSLYGVIVTLYRAARVDMRPAIPLGPTDRGKDAKFEDYYPKSLTGLGGLSLSGAGSSHVFRKDLSQVMVPLMIDPQTLAAEIRTKVRIPEEVFPTISSVPGAMISFKYYIEVVVDIQGKLAGHDRNIGNSAGLAGMAGPNLASEGSNMERSAYTPFGSTIIDTTSIRRDKSVVTCVFEVIIGTVDSERRKGKRKMEDAPAETEASQAPAPPATSEQPPQAQSNDDWYNSSADYNYQWDQQGQWYPGSHDQYGYDQRYYQYQDYGYHEPPPLAPIPQMPDESEMTEKERHQRHEDRLMPSQPPGMDDGHVDGSTAGATAPYLPEETDSAVALDWQAAPAYPRSASSPVASGARSRSGEDGRLRQMSTVPEYEPPQAGSSAQAVVDAGDVKQETQREHLEAEASAPPGDVEDGDTSAAVPEHAPSIPTMPDAQSIHDSHADAAGSSGLPRYER